MCRYLLYMYGAWIGRRSNTLILLVVTFKLALWQERWTVRMDMEIGRPSSWSPHYAYFGEGRGERAYAQRDGRTHTHTNQPHHRPSQLTPPPPPTPPPPKQKWNVLAYLVSVLAWFAVALCISSLIDVDYNWFGVSE